MSKVKITADTVCDLSEELKQRRDLPFLPLGFLSVEQCHICYLQIEVSFAFSDGRSMRP